MSTDASRPADRERLLTVAEVAAHYAVSCSTVRRWLRRGQLVAQRTPGGRYPRIPESAIAPRSGEAA